MFIGAHCSPLESNAHKLDQHWLLALTIEDHLKQMEPIRAHRSLLEPFQVCCSQIRLTLATGIK